MAPCCVCSRRHYRLALHLEQAAGKARRRRHRSRGSGADGRGAGEGSKDSASETRGGQHAQILLTEVAQAAQRKRCRDDLLQCDRQAYCTASRKEELHHHARCSNWCRVAHGRERTPVCSTDPGLVWGDRAALAVSAVLLDHLRSVSVLEVPVCSVLLSRHPQEAKLCAGRVARSSLALGIHGKIYRLRLGLTKVSFLHMGALPNYIAIATC